MGHRSVFGVIADEPAAVRLSIELCATGLVKGDLSFLAARHPVVDELEDTPRMGFTAEELATSSAGGIARIGPPFEVVFAGIGALLSAGAVFAGPEAAAASLVECLTALGVPKPHALSYERSIRRGRVLVVAGPAGEHELRIAARVLRAHDVTEVCVTRRGGPWRGNVPSA